MGGKDFGNVAVIEIRCNIDYDSWAQLLGLTLVWASSYRTRAAWMPWTWTRCAGSMKWAGSGWQRMRRMKKKTRWEAQHWPGCSRVDVSSTCSHWLPRKYRGLTWPHLMWNRLLYCQCKPRLCRACVNGNFVHCKLTPSFVVLLISVSVQSWSEALLFVLLFLFLSISTPNRDSRTWRFPFFNSNSHIWV